MDKKEKTKLSILEGAIWVLLENGVISTSMEMVSKNVGCHRRTLYRYFPQREDLLFEVVIAILHEVNKYQLDFYEELNGSGLEQLHSFLNKLLEYMDQHRPIVRFMGEFDFYFGEKSQYEPSEDLQRRFIETSHVTEDILSKIITLGLDDGSISLKEKPEVFIPTMTTVLWGTAQRVASKDSQIKGEFGISGIDMIQCQIDLYIEALRPAPSQNKGE